MPLLLLPLITIYTLQIPHNLFKEQGYEHREALFGVPPYGGSIATNLYYADSDLCDPNVDTRKGYPTRDLDKNGKMEAWPSPFILMLDRGGCTFVKKVRVVLHCVLLFLYTRSVAWFCFNRISYAILSIFPLLTIIVAPAPHCNNSIGPQRPTCWSCRCHHC